MAFEFHQERSIYFQQQYEHSRDYIIPFVAPFLSQNKNLRICEVGSAEAGVLKAFIEQGHKGIGIELNGEKIKRAESFMADELKKGLVQFYHRDIHQISKAELGEGFDLIILKDVIEHVHDQQAMLVKLKELLNEKGIIFIAMPPWRMPFGGHQQMLSHKKLSKLPYFHLLPRGMYRQVMQWSKERPEVIESQLEIKDTQISINRFYRIVAKAGLQLVRKQFYLINPNYKYKFGLKPRKQLTVIAAIPHLRDFFTTTAYFILSK
jgi:2-polyprenyl-3-methyl-5-hydroxy-6-metoxy-1,4-benzoquinol methylase